MSDTFSKRDRSRIMRSIRGKDTAPEMKVRRLAHSLGYRYRLHVHSLPGRPDLVFSKKRKVIFVHGCFWHQHSCSHMPKSNLSYWEPKLARNVARDAKNIKLLKAAGWKVEIIWECQTKNLSALEKRLVKFLG